MKKTRKSGPCWSFLRNSLILSLYSGQVLTLVTTEHETRAQLTWRAGIFIFHWLFINEGHCPELQEARPSCCCCCQAVAVGGHRSEVKLYCVITPNRIIVKLCWSSHHQSSESEQHNQDHNQPSATQPKYSSQTQFTTIFCWELEVLKKDTRGPLRFHCLSGSASPWPWILTAAFFPSAVMSLCAVISVGLWLVNCARPEADWHQTQSLRAQSLDVVTKWGAHTRRVSCLHSPHLVSLYSWWPEYYAKLFSHFPVVICSRPCW